MLTFIPGLAKLQKTKDYSDWKAPTELHLYDRNKRNRGYNIKEWEEYAWLAYDDDEKNAMFCTSCRGRSLGVGVGKIGIWGKNAFATGTDNFRHDSLRAHNVGETHRHAIVV